MKNKKVKKPLYAPREVFEQILKWSVVPTFDLVIKYGNRGFIVVKRKIAPYKNQWALPGLRMMKGEEINDTLKRIAKNEIGLQINPQLKVFLGQQVGKFKTEQQRQDLSTGYMLEVPDNQIIKLNPDHFTDYRITKKIPLPMGAMYKFYLKAGQKSEKGKAKMVKE